MKKSIQTIIDRKKCSGCYLCMNICPQNSIKISLNKEGFYYPNINKNKCNNCGLCLDRCPVNDKFEKKQPSSVESIYAAKSLDNDLKVKSSSGGIFGELARYVISKKGIVYGAMFNEENKVIHVGIENKNELDKLIGSKYLQSNIGFSYKKIKEKLFENRLVLFIGLPCQINALRKYVGYDGNLILVDLVCHGVPSQIIFKKYLKDMFRNDDIKEIQFRDKKNNKEWENFKIKIVSESSTYSRSHRKDAFFYGYLKNLYLNDICYTCNFSQIPRVSDITLGDFWGVPEEMKDKEGTSLVITNSAKGKELILELYKSKSIQIMEADIETTLKNNPRLAYGELHIPKERKELFKSIDKLSFKQINKKFIKGYDDDIYNKFINSIKDKKIIVFGTGSVLDKIALKNDIIKLDDIEYLLDNDIKKQGKKIYNRKVHGIEKLKEENKDDIFIVIASSYYEEISAQLKDLEFEENVDFIDGIKYLVYD